MWTNMTWLRAEWRYWLEWRKQYLAARLEGQAEPPKRNNPWRYTMSWIGVAVALPMTLIALVGVIGWAVVSSNAAAQFFTITGLILFGSGWVVWIVHSLVSMADKGPSYVVAEQWAKTHGKSGK